jgi:hypothetical protein
MISSIISDIAAYRTQHQGKYPARVIMNRDTHAILCEEMTAWALRRGPRVDAGKISGIPIALDETVEKWELVE